MRTLAHLSDLHFGREDPLLVEALLASVAQAKPDVIVVSGDLTQRARKKQFRAASAFLGRLPGVPHVVIPGNHDVSTTNLVVRAFEPLDRFARYITEDLSPFYADDEVAIAGINTVRVLAAKDGRIGGRQVRTACAQLARAKLGAIRIVVTHHPIDLPEQDKDNALLKRSEMAMRAFAQVPVDLFLSGHLHAGLSLATAARYPLPGFSAVVLHAGTAISTRTRGVANSWNLLRLDEDTIAIERMESAGGDFQAGAAERYRRGDSGWRLELQRPERLRSASTTLPVQAAPQR